MRLILFACTLLSAAVPAFSQRSGRQAYPFDSYLLALSWSPEFCHSHASDPQCSVGKHYGFVVHGLWPEYKTGSGPQHCGMQPGLADPSKMLDIMPSRSLIEHEWTTHGTCTGLTPDAYFGLIRKAYNSVKLPPKFTSATSQVLESPLQVKKDFEAVNGNLSDGELVITCPGNYLQGVEVCLDKNLNLMACTAPRDCRAQNIRIPPIQ